MGRPFVPVATKVEILLFYYDYTIISSLLSVEKDFLPIYLTVHPLIRTINIVLLNIYLPQISLYFYQNKLELKISFFFLFYWHCIYTRLRFILFFLWPKNWLGKIVSVVQNYNTLTNFDYIFLHFLLFKGKFSLFPSITLKKVWQFLFRCFIPNDATWFYFFKVHHFDLYRTKIICFLPSSFWTQSSSDSLIPLFS